MSKDSHGHLRKGWKDLSLGVRLFICFWIAFMGVYAAHTIYLRHQMFNLIKSETSTITINGENLQNRSLLIDNLDNFRYFKTRAGSHPEILFAVVVSDNGKVSHYQFATDSRDDDMLWVSRERKYMSIPIGYIQPSSFLQQ